MIKGPDKVLPDIYAADLLWPCATATMHLGQPISCHVHSSVGCAEPHGIFLVQACVGLHPTHALH